MYPWLSWQSIRLLTGLLQVRFLQDTLPQRCGKAIAFGFSFIIKHFFPAIRQPAAGAFSLVRFQAPVYFKERVTR